MPQKLSEPSVAEDSARQIRLISNIILQGPSSQILLSIIGIVKPFLIKDEIKLFSPTNTIKERFRIISFFYNTFRNFQKKKYELPSDHIWQLKKKRFSQL